MTSWKTIFRHLKNEGYDVRPPGGKPGVCLSPYIVLLNNGSRLDVSRALREYELLLYMPYVQYDRFEDYAKGVKICMNKLYPETKLVDDEQPHYPDDDVKAYMTSLIYRTETISAINRIEGVKQYGN